MLRQETLNALLNLSIARQLLLIVADDLAAFQDDLKPFENNLRAIHTIGCFGRLIDDLLVTRESLAEFEDSLMELCVRVLAIQNHKKSENDGDDICNLALEVLTKDREENV